MNVFLCKLLAGEFLTCMSYLFLFFSRNCPEMYDITKLSHGKYCHLISLMGWQTTQYPNLFPVVYYFPFLCFLLHSELNAFYCHKESKPWYHTTLGCRLYGVETDPIYSRPRMLRVLAMLICFLEASSLLGLSLRKT